MSEDNVAMEECADGVSVERAQGSCRVMLL